MSSAAVATISQRTALKEPVRSRTAPNRKGARLEGGVAEAEHHGGHGADVGAAGADVERQGHQGGKGDADPNADEDGPYPPAAWQRTIPMLVSMSRTAPPVRYPRREPWWSPIVATRRLTGSVTTLMTVIKAPALC